MTNRLNTSTSELRARLSLTASDIPDEMIVLKTFTLIETGYLYDLLNAPWSTTYEVVAQRFDDKVGDEGEAPAKVLIDKQVPLALGIAKPIEGGAILPIEFNGYGHPVSLFVISFYKPRNGDSIEIESLGQDHGSNWDGHPDTYLKVLHRKWNKTRHYKKADDDLLKQCLAGPVRVKQLDVPDSTVDIIRE